MVVSETSLLVFLTVFVCMFDALVDFRSVDMERSVSSLPVRRFIHGVLEDYFTVQVIRAIFTSSWDK